jgi:hypothetical protein
LVCFVDHQAGVTDRCNTNFVLLKNTERDAAVIEVDFKTSLVAAELRHPLASR